MHETYPTPLAASIVDTVRGATYSVDTFMGPSRSRSRLDQVLVERGLATTRESARSLIMAGQVRVGGRVAVKPAMLVAGDAQILVLQRPRYVGRGGEKLEHALEAFQVDPAGLTALDVGASTGGFTDCLLQRGVRRVYAVDVGHGQLDYRLRQDSRVVVMEGINARHPLPLPEPVDLATIDVSFISLRLVLGPASAALSPGGRVVALVKPQFEAGRGKVGRGGVIRDPQIHLEVLADMVTWVVQHRSELQLRLRGVTRSPLLGDAGNREFFVLLQREQPAGAR